MIEGFSHPRSVDFSTEFSLQVDGQTIEVLHTEAAAFANFIYDPADGPVTIVLRRLHDTIESFEIRPRRLALRGSAEGKELRFTIDRPHKVCVEIDGMRPFFLWANPPETDKPRADDPKVHYFKAGQVYEMDCLRLGSGETLYLEGGAVLKTRVIASEAKGVTIRGHGIFDGSFYRREWGDMVPGIILDRCREVTVRDITMIRPSAWMLVPGACEDVEIFNLKQIGEVVSSDGIDIVGSKRVHIHDCFLRNNDDCVVIKAFFLSENNLTATHFDFRQCPETILVENCTLLNAPAGK